jgi:hypothetical protein
MNKLTAQGKTSIKIEAKNKIHDKFIRLENSILSISSARENNVSKI